MTNGQLFSKIMRKTNLPKVILLSVLTSLFPHIGLATEVSITMDDPSVESTPLLKPAERNEHILKALEKNGNLKAALFVCGMRVDNTQGKKLITDWNDRGHLIANHSYSHLYYNSKDVTFDRYAKDFTDGESIIKNFSGFKRFFRFPFLKEGNSSEKRDQMREFLNKRGYKNGYVTIDASDWYIDQRLKTRLRKDPKADTAPYRDYYLKHIWDRATFYNDLAKKVLGREVKHTLLIHHSLLNALYLTDLIEMLKSHGWQVIDASDAFSDPVFDKEPNIAPAGESLIWALAKETGKFENLLRYPGEDGDYQKDEMDQLGL
jgi:peptidoglycan/xylan/chitin deacetylase (PgdA/CDA1 family)